MKINIPGLHNSDKDHWQTHFEKSFPNQFLRVEQDDWEKPDCETWINRIEERLSGLNHSELILIGHSIGCMAILKWYEKFGHDIKGALLVTPSDSEKESYPSYITGFVPIPKTRLPFPSIVVGSSDDHVSSSERVAEFAKDWGSDLIMLDKAGHIESKSGFGEWPAGLELIEALEKTETINPAIDHLTRH